MPQGSSISRRNFIKGAAFGGLALGGSSVLSGCDFGWAKGAVGGYVLPPEKETPQVTSELTFRIRSVNDEISKIVNAVNDAYYEETGIYVSSYSTESSDFDDGLFDWLQKNPDDVFQSVSGFRTNYRADQGLLYNLSGAFDRLKKELPDGFVRNATNPEDGKQYIIPISWYPWGLHYRKSSLKSLGMDTEDIETWDDLMGFLSGMRKKGKIGYALGNQGGWEAMGTFSMLNSRLNGYEFHMDLMRGKEQWSSTKTLEVFKLFETLIPFMNNDFEERSWDYMKDSLLEEKCGAIMMGSWWSQDFLDRSQKDYDDLWIIPFPEIESANGRDVIDAPVDGISVPANSLDPEGGAALAEFWGSETAMRAAQNAGDYSHFANRAYQDGEMTPFVQQQVSMTFNSRYVTNFLDRDTRVDFAGSSVGPAIQEFLSNPSRIKGILEDLDAAWERLPAF